MRRSLTVPDAGRAAIAVKAHALFALGLIALRGPLFGILWTDLVPAVLLVTAARVRGRSVIAARTAVGLTAGYMLVGAATIGFGAAGRSTSWLPLGPAIGREGTACLAGSSFPTLLLGYVALRRLVEALRRAEFADPQACRACGYDLSHSAERCPECGRPIDAQAADANRRR
jgi:hypothetical protein